MWAKPSCAAGWQIYCWGLSWRGKSTGDWAMQNEPIEVTLKVTGVPEQLGIP
jgi:hypothetical protein